MGLDANAKPTSTQLQKVPCMFLASLRIFRRQRELLISSCGEARHFSSSYSLPPLGPSCRRREPNVTISCRLLPCEPAGPAMQPMPAAPSLCQALGVPWAPMPSCAGRGMTSAAATAMPSDAMPGGTHVAAAAAAAPTATGRPYSSSASQRLLDMRHPASWYPLARQTKRTIIAHLGPTNSGVDAVVWNANTTMACAMVWTMV